MMFSTIPSSVAPLKLDSISKRRRSKSLDDITYKKKDQDRLSYYQHTCSPTSPIVTFQNNTVDLDKVPKRRHSLYAEPTNNKEYIRLATIYGWVTTAKDINTIATTTSTPGRSMHESIRRLQTSRSFSHLPVTSSKITRMFGKKSLHTADSLSSLFPHKTITGGNTCHGHIKQSHSFHDLNVGHKNIMSAIIASASSTDEDEQLGWIGIEEHVPTSKSSLEEQEPPPPPIENDPHIFDLVTKDSSHFIHYGKCDATVTSATVEKLIEKLTREMDNEFLMDFFLTFRQYLTPIKLCKLLMLRFRWALLQEDDTRCLVRIRTFVVIRHWLTHYWTHDFTSSRTLRFMLSTFLTQLQTHPAILASPRDERIIKNLRNVLKRQRKFYQNATAEETQAPTFVLLACQQQMQQQTSRKDSAIAIASCRNSVHDPGKPTEEGPTPWTTKVRRSIKRTVSQSIRSHSAISINVTNQSAISNSTTATPLISSSSNTSISTVNNANASPLLQPCNSHCSASCVMHTPTASPSHLKYQSTRSRLLFSYRSLSNASYKSIVLKYRSEIIAQQFCLIEKAMLQNVTWDELVELRWRKRSSKRQSFVIDMVTLGEDGQDGLGVDQLIGYFNMTCQWVASEVVRSQQLEMRVKVIEKFIRIALKCYHHRNYSTLMQVLLGLQSPAVSRLERTWQKIDHCQMELFDKLKEMAKPFKNWKNVRGCMTKATEEVAESFAVESVLTKSLKEFDHTHGCIPFLGLYLSDLVFVAELPTFIESSSAESQNSQEEDEQDKQLSERLCNHLVNYNKFRITASVVKHVLAFQVLSRAYNFKTHQPLYTQLQSMSLLDNAQIRKASFLCEE